MTILDITDIIRKENFIYYRREFSAVAHIDLPGRPCTGKIEFTIETAPTGKKEIKVRTIDPFDYPLIPLVQKLRESISSLEREGKLP